MKTNRRIRVTYANVVATLALFAALGGSSYAAIAVTGAQVRDGSLTGHDVRNSSLTGRDVRNQSLLAQDFKPGQLPAGPQGPKGDAGDPGPKGEKGDPGLPGISGYEQVVVDKQINTDITLFTEVKATCPAGKVVIGGGAEILEPTKASLDAVLDASAPQGTRTWRAEAHGFGGFKYTVEATAICVNAA